MDQLFDGDELNWIQKSFALLPHSTRRSVECIHCLLLLTDHAHLQY